MKLLRSTVSIKMQASGGTVLKGSVNKFFLPCWRKYPIIARPEIRSITNIIAILFPTFRFLIVPFKINK
jgi:hypothetical protein